MTEAKILKIGTKPATKPEIIDNANHHGLTPVIIHNIYYYKWVLQHAIQVYLFFETSPIIR